MPKKRKTVNLGKGGCLCWDKATYSPECCDPDDPKAERMGKGTAPVEEDEEP